MTAITFPNNPSSGDTHTAGNGIVYTYDGEKWTSIGTNSAGTWTRSGTEVSLTNAGDDLNVDSGTLFVDASTDRVGVGTSSPGANLEIKESATSGTNHPMQIWRTASGGFMQLRVENLGLSQPYHEFTTGTGEDIVFNPGTGGNVGIGTTTVSDKLHIGGGNICLSYADGSTGLRNKISWRTESPFFDEAAYIAVNRTGVSGAPSDIVFATGGAAAATEKARITSSGQLLVGTSSARSDFGSTTAYRVQVEGTDLAGSSLSLTRNTNSNAGPGLQFAKSRASANGGNVIVQNNDVLAYILFDGNDGADFARAAQITAEVDGTPGANDMPGRLVFSTTADGASSPTERVRITNAGAFKASTNGTYSQGTTSINHEFNQSNSLRTVFNNSNASPFGIYITYSTTDPNGTANEFVYCEGNGTLRANIRSNGGLANYSANNVNLSDINTKKDIAPATGTWDCLKEWEIVNFRYKDQSDDAGLNMGVIAQQVAESCPEVITVFQEAKEATEDQPAQEERLGVKDQQMMWMAIKALQEAQLRIETLEAEVAALKAS